MTIYSFLKYLDSLGLGALSDGYYVEHVGKIELNSCLLIDIYFFYTKWQNILS